MNVDSQLLSEGRKLFVTGHKEESIDYFTAAAQQDCNPVVVYLDRGAAYLSVNNYEQAIVDFNRVLRIDVDNDRALYYRAIAYLNIGAFADAISDLNKSIEVNHNRGTAFLARSMAHAELSHDDEALRDLKTAVSFSNVEVERFMTLYGNNRTMFGKFMALCEGDRGPLSIVLDKEEAHKVEKWIQ